MCYRTGFDYSMFISVMNESKYHTIYQPHRSGKIWHKVNFKAEFNRFEFRIFLLLD